MKVPLLLSLALSAVLPWQVSASEPLLAFSPVLQRDLPPGNPQNANVIPAADGGLGTTMTLAQQGKSASAVELEQKKILNVQPAGESSPALRHRLWLPDFTLKPGSAALHFGRALLMWKDLPSEFRGRVSGWSFDEEPPTPAEREDAVDTLQNVYAELHLLAVSEDWEWDHRLRDISGPQLYAYLFPEIQQSRELARVLKVKIRHQLSQQDFEGAVESLRDGFRLAAFVCQGETLIQQLVGIAIESLMLEEVEQMIQLSGSPNMYWALATLPRPFTDVNRSVQFELSSIHRVIPALAEAETESRDEAYWSATWAEVLDSMEALGGFDNDSNKLAFAVLGAVAAAPAKKRLIQSGMDPELVEAMPAIRAVLLDASREIRIIADDLAKANYLPVPLGTEIGDQAEQEFQKWLRENIFTSGGAAIVGLLFPTVQAARAAGVRQEYVINRLMTIEALRLHAHEHAGSLPASLDQLSPVPALPNPFTGEPFQYELQSSAGESTVTLTADVPRSANYLRQITIRFASRP